MASIKKQQQHQQLQQQQQHHLRPSSILISGEKKQLNRILEEQEAQNLKRSRDNIASVLRKNALLLSRRTLNSNNNNNNNNNNINNNYSTIKRIISLKDKRSNYSISNNNNSLKSACPYDSVSSLTNVELFGASNNNNFSRNDISHSDNVITKSVNSVKKSQNSPESSQHSEHLHRPNDRLKRAYSIQNIQSKATTPATTTTTTTKPAVAYNAELLIKFEKEKKLLDAKILELTDLAESRGREIERLEGVLVNEREKNRAEEISQLKSENLALKQQLRENGISIEHFTDSEKLFLLEKMMSRNGGRVQSVNEHSTVNLNPDPIDQADFRLSSEELNDIAHRYRTLYSNNDHDNDVDDDDNEDNSDLIATTNLDRHNSMSVDRGLNAVSVADLRERLVQMQESQHSVNEELQATLQELIDLQENVNQLNEVNDSLKMDRKILLESLCSTTEKLENSRRQVDNLKSLLISNPLLMHHNNDNGDTNDSSSCSNSKAASRQQSVDRESQLVALVNCAEQEKEELLLKQAEYEKMVGTMEVENRELRDAVHSLRCNGSCLAASVATAAADDVDDDCDGGRVKICDSCLNNHNISHHNSTACYDTQGGDQQQQKLQQQVNMLTEQLKEQADTVELLQGNLSAAQLAKNLLKRELNTCRLNFNVEKDEWLQFQSDLQIAVVVANEINIQLEEEVDRLRNEKKLLQQQTLSKHSNNTNNNNNINNINNSNDINAINNKINDINCASSLKTNINGHDPSTKTTTNNNNNNNSNNNKNISINNIKIIDYNDINTAIKYIDDDDDDDNNIDKNNNSSEEVPILSNANNDIIINIVANVHPEANVTKIDIS
ncbi:hypothetical protein HELRODRAFT_169764 [Helobdella robusta]|uniref:Uncharacterized protein n=1 Tax=Helobdella robusta TaxID=6412 RepID=T1F2B1_HELRO|nr:hypothetical protein HELRODRAFT_169764 [Helobdella robusta]ESO08040.1 hypothetical protein HELRODRAFT_169764 [Helobdella robusta]